MRWRFIWTFTAFVTFEFVRIILYVFVVRIDVGAFDEFGPFAVEEVEFLLTGIGKTFFPIRLRWINERDNGSHTPYQ